MDLKGWLLQPYLRAFTKSDSRSIKDYEKQNF